MTVKGRDPILRDIQLAFANRRLRGLIKESTESLYAQCSEMTEQERKEFLDSLRASDD